MIVYKGQGIDWHPQSDSLGVSPLKQTRSTLTLVSGSCCLVESLRQWICFIGCFSERPVNRCMMWEEERDQDDDDWYNPHREQCSDCNQNSCDSTKCIDGNLPYR